MRFVVKAVMGGWEGDGVGLRLLLGCRAAEVDCEGAGGVVPFRGQRLRRASVLRRRCEGIVLFRGCFCVRRRRVWYGILREWIYERITRLVGRGARRF